MNLYCRLMKCDATSAEYAVGSYSNQLTGLARFFSDERMPEILIPWEESESHARYKLCCTYWKYEECLKSGIFPGKMSREIG